MAFLCFEDWLLLLLFPSPEMRWAKKGGYMKKACSWLHGVVGYDDRVSHHGCRIRRDSSFGPGIRLLGTEVYRV